MQRTERQSSDDEACCRPDQRGVAGWDKKEKLAKNLLEVGKTRLNYNESEIENIVKLYEELQELDKKAVSYGQQFKPLTITFRCSPVGAHWSRTKSTGTS